MVCEKFEFGIFHCPCSLLGVSDGRAISDEYRTQTVRFRSYWLPVLLTLLNWSTVRAASADGTVTLHYAENADGCWMMVEGDSSVYAVDLDTVQALLITAAALKAE